MYGVLQCRVGGLYQFQVQRLVYGLHRTLTRLINKPYQRNTIKIVRFYLSSSLLRYITLDTPPAQNMDLLYLIIVKKCVNFHKYDPFERAVGYFKA